MRYGSKSPSKLYSRFCGVQITQVRAVLPNSLLSPHSMTATYCLAAVAMRVCVIGRSAARTTGQADDSRNEHRFFAIQCNRPFGPGCQFETEQEGLSTDMVV